VRDLEQAAVAFATDAVRAVEAVQTLQASLLRAIADADAGMWRSLLAALGAAAVAVTAMVALPFLPGAVVAVVAAGAAAGTAAISLAVTVTLGGVAVLSTALAGWSLYNAYQHYEIRAELQTLVSKLNQLSGAVTRLQGEIVRVLTAEAARARANAHVAGTASGSPWMPVLALGAVVAVMAGVLVAQWLAARARADHGEL